MNVEKIPESNTVNDDNVILTPWKADGKFTSSVYKKLIEKFGVQEITPELLERFEKVTGHKPHPLLRNGLFFAHRGLEEILNDHELKKPIFIYTGRGPSGEMHLGHLIPMQFTVWLQKVFNAVVVFQIADDEKFFFKKGPFEKFYELGKTNAKDIIALGFDSKKTYLFSNHDIKSHAPYKRVVDDLANIVKLSDIEAIFGLSKEKNNTIGQAMWPIYQSVAAFSKSYGSLFDNRNVRCLVAYAVDQDPYFRLCRDNAEKLGFLKPCGIMCRFLPALEGDAKMSTTNTLEGPSKTIFMHSTPEEIKEMIHSHGFSGGQKTLELHRKLGGRTDIDVSYQWLRHFMNDDAKLKELKDLYESGKMTTKEMKDECVRVVCDVVRHHQNMVKKISPEIISSFYSVDNIDFIYPKPDVTDQDKELIKILDELKIPFNLLKHNSITTMDEGKELMKKLDGSVPLNLLLKDKKGTYYLVVKALTNKTKINQIGKALKINGIKMAKSDELMSILGVPKGTVSPLALHKAGSHKIILLIDEMLPKKGQINFHPLRNDYTMTLDIEDLFKYVKKLNVDIIYF